jgi:ATP-dependent exoDNAse (exonuclease V) beta subunit
MYVALTRPEDSLYILRSEHSVFTNEIERVLKKNVT